MTRQEDKEGTQVLSVIIILPWYNFFMVFEHSVKFALLSKFFGGVIRYKRDSASASFTACSVY